MHPQTVLDPSECTHETSSCQCDRISLSEKGREGVDANVRGYRYVRTLAEKSKEVP